MAITFNRTQFIQALELVEKAKLKGLKNLGLIKIKLEMDALTNGVYPEISLVTATGRHYDYIGDDFPQGMDALRKLIANAYKGAAANEQA